jgi:hypothetical protein
MTKIVRIPNQILAPIIAILCFLGAYVAKNYVFDIWITVALGVFAFFATRNGYPTVPMILGFILADLIEGNFHRALGVGFGSPLIFVTRPIALVMIAVTAVFLAWPWIVDWIRRRRAESGGSAEILSAITDKEATEVPMGEILFGGFVALLLAVFLATSFGYSPDVRLFPVIVSVVGLALMAVWIVGAVRHSKITPWAFGGLTRVKGGLPWLYGLALLVGYAVLVPAIGFLAASVIYFVVTVVVAGYKLTRLRALAVAATTGGIVLFLLAFPRFLQIELPVGPWGF